VAVGRAVRSACKVAVFTAGVPVGGMGRGAWVGVSVGGDNGDAIDSVGLGKGEARGESGGTSPFLCVRHTKNTADTPTANPNATKKRTRYLT
jgi:hypothetical protein